MWTGLGISFAIYFVGIFVLDGLSETYYDIPCTTTARECACRASCHTRITHQRARRDAGPWGRGGATATMFTTAGLYFGTILVIAIGMTPMVSWR